MSPIRPGSELGRQYTKQRDHRSGVGLRRVIIFDSTLGSLSVYCLYDDSEPFKVPIFEVRSLDPISSLFKN